MFVLLLILGCLLAGFGTVAIFMNLPVENRDIPLRQVFSELFDNDKFTISVFCMVLGYLILFFLGYCAF